MRKTTRDRFCPQGRHRLPEVWFPSRGCRGCANEEALAHATAVVVGALPGVAEQRARTALEAVAASGAEEYRGNRYRKIAAYLSESPQALTAGAATMPLDVARLVSQLREAGHGEVADPCCADCGRPCWPRYRRPDGLRICSVCDGHRRRVPCGRCGRVNRVARRDADGAPLCLGCHRADPSSWQTCGVCQQPASIRATIGGVRVGRCCYRKPHERCSVCGLGRAVSPYASGTATCADCATRDRATCVKCGLDAPVATSGEPICLRCQNSVNLPCRVCDRPTVSRDRDGSPRCSTCLTRTPRRCGSCGQVRVITRRADGGDPDLCGSCWQGPVLACDRCGRQRPCRGERTGRMLCATCRPRRRPQCAYCGHHRAATVVWADGPACAQCYRRFMRAKGTCPGCQQYRRLLPYVGQPQPCCAPCAGAASGPVCGRCGNEDWLYHKDRCARCVLDDRLSALLGDADNRARLGLQHLHDALLHAERPETIIGWMRPSSQGTAHALLAQLGRGEILLSHDTLDALNTPGNGGTANHLDAILTAVGALPARDVELARLERAVPQALTGVTDETNRKILRSYATWDLLRRARAVSQTEPLSAQARYKALNRLATAAHLLDWLSHRGSSLDGCKQAELDGYLAHHPIRRNDLHGFLAWARRTRRVRDLAIPSAPKSLPRTIAAEDEHRWSVARALLHDDGHAPADRVAGLLVLLFAQRSARISRLTVSDVSIADDRVSITLGTAPIHLPEPFAGHLRQLVATRRPLVGAHVTDPGPWLFPGKHPGRPVLPATITSRLQRVGIQPAAQRTAALLHLAGEMPPALLGQLLGLGRTAVHEWSTLAGRPWAGFLAARLEDTEGDRM